ncbi:MAG: hypothetical protein J5X22_09385 [Candidatus Accumulibacter sp.]|uniref:hypothetical protein n=1 Tax=Accumulibacter sp. TaxID=2053492 RepID=UPI001AC12B67|nr:hypothetical protein [Accumulibacter sp.]MBN8516803.1 hypothetical protein [Accumulibacter sp.]MBO3710714.1 hypothetical protein [Accumulibacter sp.]
MMEADFWNAARLLSLAAMGFWLVGMKMGWFWRVCLVPVLILFAFSDGVMAGGHEAGLMWWYLLAPVIGVGAGVLKRLFAPRSGCDPKS